ncbi:MAG: hypothetical protein JNM56_22260 [Planctomycetia bacterium]|nr:hypothetical protein [Planctomycetia bacterium]
MPDETIMCPACNRKLRVPEQELGQVVQCPLCRAVFTAPMRASAPLPEVLPVHPQPAGSGVQSRTIEPAPPVAETAQPPAAEREPSDDESPSPEETVAAEDAARLRELQRVLLVPAMGLLVSGIFGLFGAAREISNCWSLGAPGWGGEIEQRRQALPSWMAGLSPPPSPEVAEVHFYLYLLIQCFLLFIALSVVFGAVQMLRLRNYWLAVICCCLSFVNCSPTCMLSAPFGLWSLLVLRHPDVRDAFG